jgi:hypothetical protein
MKPRSREHHIQSPIPLAVAASRDPGIVERLARIAAFPSLTPANRLPCPGLGSKHRVFRKRSAPLLPSHKRYAIDCQMQYGRLRTLNTLKV